MKKDKTFPAVITAQTAGRHYGLAGLRLESILKLELAKKELLQGDTGNKDQNSSWNGSHGIKALLQAISGWPDDTTLEMMLTVHPDLVNRPQGVIDISIMIRTNGTTRKAVLEKTIGRYLALANLLPAHLPEADFTPLTERRALSRTLAPFKAKTALSLHRRARTITLSHPFKQAASVGFSGNTVPDHENRSPQAVHHIFPWKPTPDTWRRLLDTMLAQLDPVRFLIRLKKSSPQETQSALERLDKVIMACEQFLAASNHGIVLRRQAESLRDLSLSQIAGLQENGFRLGAYLTSAGNLDPSLGQVAGNAVTAATAGPGNLIDLLLGGFQVTEINPRNVADPDFFDKTEPFTLQEAACAFRLPSPPTENQLGLPTRNFRTCMARMPAVENGDQAITLAVNRHRQLSQPILATADDRMRHTFIIGQTGTGKSTMMEAMILQDIRAGRGVAVIDPHGEMVEEILGKIPSGRQDDVIYFNLLDRERPPGFNLLQWSTIEERDMIIDELYLTVDHLYDMRKTGGPIFDQYFRGMLRLLMGDRRDDSFTPTLLEFVNCFQDRGFRHWLKSRTSDPQTIDFLKQVEDASGDASLANVTPYITSKLTRFTLDNTIQRIIGQETLSIDFEEVMNSGKILLMNLGKGRLGSTISALIANQVVARFKQAAMKRGETRMEERRDFLLYVDECHNLPAGSFSELLSEARKYRLGLILATQYAAQLRKKGGSELSGNLLDAITGNVGTIFIFRIGNSDAELMSPLLYPSFSKEDIIGLPNWHGYCRLQPGGESVPPCSFIGIKDEQVRDDRVAARVREASRKKYGTDTKKVARLIRERHDRWRKL